MQGQSQATHRLCRVSEPVKEEYAAPPAIERDGLSACDERRRLGARVDAVGHPFHDARFHADAQVPVMMPNVGRLVPRDRKSTRLNSSHSQISYAVFCL